MPAYFDTGFMVREPAWHREGYVADRFPENWAEARKWAGLEWEPISAPAFGFSGIRADGTVTYDPAEADSGDYFQDAERQRIVRSDTGDLLGTPSNWYQVISHTEMGEVVEAILDQPGVKYETAGSVQGGKQVWALAWHDEPLTLPGDNTPTMPYLALTTRHDGSGALRAQSTNVRIVCWNTFSAAETQADRNGTVCTFSHTGNWRDRIEEAREAITGVRREFAEYQEFAEELLAVKVTHEQTEQFVRAFIEEPPTGLVSDRVRNNVEDARNAVRTILASPTTETIAGTAFGLVQASGEYLDHYRKARSLDSYYTRQLLRPEPLKRRAVAIVREVVGV